MSSGSLHKKRMNHSSDLKENLNKSSYHLKTSPLTDLQKLKETNILKNSIQNDFMTKLSQFRSSEKHLPKVSSPKPVRHSDHEIDKEMSFAQMKAGAKIYQVPEFCSPEVAFEVSDAIRERVSKIRSEMVEEAQSGGDSVPKIYNGKTVQLPEITKSASRKQLSPPQSRNANYNPKNIENLFNHRSTVKELQEWLKRQLLEPPVSERETVDYKNMIMGIGMKDLIRIVRSRCREEGEMVEQVWELTWSICREIIVYLSKRARKCELILEEELKEFERGQKQDYQEVRTRCEEQRLRIEELEAGERGLKQQLEALGEEHERSLTLNKFNSQRSDLFNEQYLHVLQENLALYLNVGDKSKKEWIRKMYFQVSQARKSIQEALKAQVNKAMGSRLAEERVFEDDLQEDLELDQNGDYVAACAKKGNSEASGEQGRGSGEQNSEEQSYHGDDVCISLNDQLQKEFELKEQEAQTEEQAVETLEEETQYELENREEWYLDVEIGTDEIERADTETDTSDLLELTGVSKPTAKPKVSKASKNVQGRESKLGGNLKGAVKAGKTPKAKGDQQRNQSSFITENGALLDMSPQEVSELVAQASTETHVKTVSTEGQEAKEHHIIEYLCKECSCKKGQLELELQRSQSKEAEVSPKEQKGASRSGFNRQPNRRKSNFMPANVVSMNGRSRSPIPSSKHIQHSPNKQRLQEIPENKELLESYQNESDDVQVVKSSFKRKNRTVKNNTINEGFSSRNIDSEGYSSHRDSPNASLEKQSNRVGRRRDSSLLHDIQYKREIDSRDNSGDEADEGSQERCPYRKTRLPLLRKEPYFNFFTEQIAQANEEEMAKMGSSLPGHGNSEYILDNYFSMVQEINSVPESRILLSEKQMTFTIEKNLMPIIQELLNAVKKAVQRQKTHEAIRGFHSLPFTVMNKFSTKYGVKILAVKNMKLLLMSLKKMETLTNRYKTLRLMLFTDCRAYFSEDLFVYLLLLATVSPQGNVDKDVTYEEVLTIREICEQYLTREKRVYLEFEELTQEALGVGSSSSGLEAGALKLAPLIRSIITNYRMIKINRIEEMGFVFLMLRNESNLLDFKTFSFFVCCLKMETELKVRVVKTFLANCDQKNKQKVMSMSESAYSRFLIRCSEFNFHFLQTLIRSHKADFKQMVTRVEMGTPLSRSSKQFFGGTEQISEKSSHDPAEEGSTKNLGTSNKARVSLNLQNTVSFQEKRVTNKRLETERQILMTSRQDLLGAPTCRLAERKAEETDPRVHKQPSLLTSAQELVEPGAMKVQSGQSPGRNMSRNPQRLRQYSYFTFQLTKFLESEEETKFMSAEQKQFVYSYLECHVMYCEVESVIGIVDYFSNDMLEIICLDERHLSIHMSQGLTAKTALSRS